VKKTMSQRAVIYVNFSQYDNAGRILDYLREQFTTVLHFSFDHLRLKNGRKTNLITVYQRGKRPDINTLYSFRVPPPLLFPSLPIVGLLMAFQTIRHSLTFQKKVGRVTFFSVNAYPVLIGIILKFLGVTSHVTYWVWDYYPVRGPDWTLRIIRYAYLIFDMIALRCSDTLIFPNSRQRRLRQTLHGIYGSHAIIPLGAAKPITFHSNTSHILGFLGMIKSSQGLDLVLSCFDDMLRQNPNLQLEIIGSGPEEAYMRDKAKKYGKRVKFFGFIEDQNAVNRIVRRWFAGLAVYEPTAGNESYFGDPSKIKVYLSQGVPIITTNVTEYGKKTSRYQIGLTILYRTKDLIYAVSALHKRQRYYRKNALVYAKTLYYRTLYKDMFPHANKLRYSRFHTATR